MKVYIVEDSPSLRRNMVNVVEEILSPIKDQFLEEGESINVLESDGRINLSKCPKDELVLFILDIELPFESDGIDLAKEIRENKKINSKIIFYSQEILKGNGNKANIYNLKNISIYGDGAVLKNDPSNYLRLAIETILISGGSWFSRRIKDALNIVKESEGEFFFLSDDQKKLLINYLSGKSPREIAILFLQENGDTDFDEEKIKNKINSVNTTKNTIKNNWIDKRPIEYSEEEEELKKLFLNPLALFFYLLDKNDPIIHEVVSRLGYKGITLLR